MARVLVEARGQTLALDVDDAPPLGWRFWTFAGFAADPVEPRPYGGSRGIPMAFTESGHWLTAMELDDSGQLFTPHELFQCADQGGAAEFGLGWIGRHAVQPDLFGVVA